MKPRRRTRRCGCPLAEDVPRRAKKWGRRWTKRTDNAPRRCRSREIRHGRHGKKPGGIQPPGEGPAPKLISLDARPAASLFPADDLISRKQVWVFTPGLGHRFRVSTLVTVLDFGDRVEPIALGGVVIHSRSQTAWTLDLPIPRLIRSGLRKGTTRSPLYTPLHRGFLFCEIPG